MSLVGVRSRRRAEGHNKVYTSLDFLAGGGCSGGTESVATAGNKHGIAARTKAKDKGTHILGAFCAFVVLAVVSVFVVGVLVVG